MLDEKEKEDMGFDREIYDFQIAQLFSRYNESELKRVILDDPAFQDNFEAGFSRVLSSLR